MTPTPTSPTSPSSSKPKPKTFDPRKRVAVRKARGAQLKATIEQNRTASPLLSLPNEVLEQIFTHVVGGQVVHIRCFERKTLTHTLCTAREEQEVAYEVSKYGHVGRVLTSGEEEEAKVETKGEGEEATEYSGQTYGERHAGCFAIAQGRCPGKPQLSPALLRVSRRAYEMGDHILLGTNTFAFSDVRSLHGFMGSLHIKRKPKINKLQIGLPCRAPRPGYGPIWDDILDGPLLRPLGSLELYELDIHDERPYLMSAYLGFKKMPVKRARLILSGYHAENERVVHRRFACQIELKLLHDRSSGPWNLEALCEERLQVERDEREAFIRAREE
ncbi:MAG: hypothetical protein Q9208_006359 [Pyrenodesmia sp. 3 TL-2023]